ncbi:hypothetical protein TNCV_3046631 [Trichonephila clavipes]|uniref:Uncharacterized protein n=1 Tax=Trichonephila clavipes TaxID=2585209 RepID=A0A8X6RP45_TRICX|nr:hypothetical protein TNCV_3046631 [Trichonephila clavipes]
MSSMQLARNIREPMNLKSAYALNLYSAEYHAIMGHGINTRTQTCASAGCGMMSERPILQTAGRTDHQHLFFPLVGMWRKVYLYGWDRSDFFPLQQY